MSGNRIEVEWLSSNQAVLAAIEKVNRKMDDTSKTVEKLGRKSEQSAKGAEGSFAKLEQELRENERALKRMQIGTAEFDKQRRKVDRLRQSLTAAKGQLQGNAQQAGMFSQLASAGVAKLAGIAGGLASVNTVASALVAELEKVKQIQIAAAGTQRTFEQSLADLGQNIGAEALPEARQRIQAAAPELGTTQAGLANLVGTAISAGAKDLDQAFGVASAALKLTVGDAERAQALVGSTLDIATLGGTQNFEAALGQLLQVQSQVRSTNLSEFAANIGPALAAATGGGQNIEGVSTERALELAGVVSQIIKDPSGSNTATAIRQFVARLDAFVPELETTLKDGTVSTLTQQQIDDFRGSGTLDERLQLFRQNESLARQFLDQQREGIGKVAVSEIVLGTQRALQLEQGAGQAITGFAGSQQVFGDLVKAVDANAAALRNAGTAGANLERLQTGGVIGLQGQAREVLQTTLENIDLPGLDRSARLRAATVFESRTAIGDDTAQAAINALVSATRRTGTFAGFQRELSDEERDFLQSQIAVLSDLSTEIRALRSERARPQTVKVETEQPPAEKPVPAEAVP